MKHYTIEITVDGQKRHEVWSGSNPADAKHAACKSLHLAYGSGYGRWCVGRATEATEAEIEMDRRLIELLLAA